MCFYLEICGGSRQGARQTFFFPESVLFPKNNEFSVGMNHAIYLGCTFVFMSFNLLFLNKKTGYSDVHGYGARGTVMVHP